MVRPSGQLIEKNRTKTPALGSRSGHHWFQNTQPGPAAVTHVNVIAIHVVEDADPVPYLVIQFIDGLTVQENLDRTGPRLVRHQGGSPGAASGAVARRSTARRAT